MIKNQHGPADEIPVTGASIETSAGASALEQAMLFDDLGDALEAHVRMLTDAIRGHRSAASRYRAGAAGEVEVASRVERVLVDLGSADWHLLADRRWPGTRANLDLLLVGPPGVVVIDAKQMADPGIVGGSLFNGQSCEDDQVDGVRDQADAVAAALSHVGLAPTAVHPMLVLSRRDLAPTDLRGITVVGAASVQKALVRLGNLLKSEDVERVVSALNEVCPPRAASTRPVRVVSPATAATPRQDDADDALLSRDEVWTSLVELASKEPMESWMVWLHPAQAQLVTGRANGPARIRGVAGSGKSVVALHKAARMSRTPGARILVTTYVRSLPTVQRSLFERLSPSTVERVEFMGLHAWASRLLAQRGIPFDLGEPGRDARSAWTRAWASSGVARDLFATGLPTTYWQDEVSHVVKGRGLRSLDDYLALDRVGRRTPLRAEQRQLVWTLYERYQAVLAEDGIVDYDDVIDLALASVRDDPLDPAYTSVVVDEAQDLSCQGMRLLHALVGDQPDGLLVVGDGQQAVYPGGYTLKEAGVSVTGRSTVLSRNYRNGEEIVRAAVQIVGDDDFADLDVERDSAARALVTERRGGIVRRFPSVDRRSQRAELIADLLIQLDSGVRPSDIAVLTPRVADAHDWRSVLSEAGVPTIDLASYDGRTVDGVKVGTYQRAKGLEFAQVYIPDSQSAITAPHGAQTAESLRERNELERRCLFVAMTRARDRLWIGTVAAP